MTLAVVLSQNEIDELLNAISSGESVVVEDVVEVDHDVVKVYDFKTANKFNKEHLRALHFIHDNFARLFSTSLATTIGGVCDVKVVSIEERTYSEFINSLPTPIIFGIFSLEPLHGTSLMQFSANVVFSIISRLLGGSGDSKTTNRPFTDIELIIMERIIRQVESIIKESWEKIVAVQATLERLETSAQFAQIVSLNETIAIITLSVSVDGSEGLVNFCIPYVAIEPISKKMNTKTLFSREAKRKGLKSNSDVIKHRINETPLTLKAVLSETTVPLVDILNLQVGDVIQLDNRVDEKVKIFIEHLPKLKGTLGVKNKRYAIKISDILNEEENNDD